eukprot:TRINITY_DN4274_c0_g3_i1.p1 TRINITY_DN4274_c0_g3~~TRINITY_DN4274_c0_g3_i1.p1  ORF type:complete len:250 (+),score=43.26 TRINITY_DN4274_c0_g3_i1:55-750(+)
MAPAAAPVTANHRARRWMVSGVRAAGPAALAGMAVASAAWAVFTSGPGTLAPTQLNAASVSARAAGTTADQSSGPYTRLASDFTVHPIGADGRCLFRAISAGVGTGDSAKAADDIRAAVVAELQKRRAEVEWFLEEPFDTYVAKMARPTTWGGEPELLMASFVLQRPLWVWMPGELVDPSRHSGRLVRTASYGDDLGKGQDGVVNLRYSGSHYELLQDLQKQANNEIRSRL